MLMLRDQILGGGSPKCGIHTTQASLLHPCQRIPLCAGPLPERGSALHRKLSVCASVGPHLSGKDGGGRVRHCYLPKGHTESHLHHTYQGRALRRSCTMLILAEILSHEYIYDTRVGFCLDIDLVCQCEMWPFVFNSSTICVYVCVCVQIFVFCILCVCVFVCVGVLQLEWLVVVTSLSLSVRVRACVFVVFRRWAIRSTARCRSSLKTWDLWRVMSPSTPVHRALSWQPRCALCINATLCLC